MKVGATILTYNHLSTGRADLFDQTLETIQDIGDDFDVEFKLYIVDNGSMDGTEEKVRKLGGFCCKDPNTTSGHGTNVCARILQGANVDISVLSDDDMAWTPGWLAQLCDWYRGLPRDVVLTGCHLEPEFPWNAITAKLTVGERIGLIRHSTGAASWSFRSQDWPKIGPIAEKIQGWGDVPACDAVRARGLRIAQIDLATHAGQFVSTWGNPPNEHAVLDREKWGIA